MFVPLHAFILFLFSFNYQCKYFGLEYIIPLKEGCTRIATDISKFTANICLGKYPYFMTMCLIQYTFEKTLRTIIIGLQSVMKWNNNTCVYKTRFTNFSMSFVL